MPTSTDDLDRPLYGAAAIALAAGVVNERGKPDLRRVYHMLARNYLPASKVGRIYVSTKRRVRSVATGEAAA